ncbi:MAG: hypothetical protein QM768_16880 [Agriterribacter sp.]
MENLHKEMLGAAFESGLASVEKLVSCGADICYTDAREILPCLLLPGGSTKALDCFTA